MTSIQKTSREMMTSARLREASGRAFDRAVELARIFLSFVILMLHALSVHQGSFGCERVNGGIKFQVVRKRAPSCEAMR
jgi:hypothetical protein